MDEDFFLINRMKRGDDSAVEQLVKKYYGDILKYSYRHMFGSSEAEDITQETFVKFFEHFDTYKHYGKVKNYLYVIAGNLCKNYYKKNQQEIQQPIIEEIFNETEQSETKIDLENALKKLPEEYREVLILYYFQNLKQEERFVLLSTHIVSDVEYIANEILLMSEGKIIEKGTAEELINSMPTKVWDCFIQKTQIGQYEKKYKVINLKLIDSGAELRVLADEKPNDSAKEAKKTLEDVYLYYFCLLELFYL